VKTIMSTALQSITPITLEEFLLRPDREDGQKEELIEGEIVLSPEPRPSHAEILERLRELLRPLKEKGFAIAGGFSCILRPRSMPGPDLAAISQERWRETVAKDAWLEGAPELVIEVRSPSNRKLGQKATLYLEHGAEAVWVVNPKRRAVVIYDQDGVREARENEQLAFHEVTVEVAGIFRG
jgi:Uma2 family endonuclease